MYLQKYKKNNYSQFGEDGILDEILERLGKKISLNRWCVEFGAWDGISCSNTCNLIRHKNYKGILIESDRKKYQEARIALALNGAYLSVQDNQIVARIKIAYPRKFLAPLVAVPGLGVISVEEGLFWILQQEGWYHTGHVEYVAERPL